MSEEDKISRSRNQSIPVCSESQVQVKLSLPEVQVALSAQRGEFVIILMLSSQRSSERMIVSQFVPVNSLGHSHV